MNNNSSITHRDIINSIKNKPYNTETSIKILSLFLKNMRKNVINGYSVNLYSIGKIFIERHNRKRAIINKKELYKKGNVKEVINSKYFDVSFKVKVQGDLMNRNGYVFKKGDVFKDELVNKINNDIVYYRKAD